MKNPIAKPQNLDENIRLRKQKRTRYRNIRCWNEQRINTKEKEVYEELERFKIDIAVPSETK